MFGWDGLCMHKDGYSIRTFLGFSSWVFMIIEKKMISMFVLTTFMVLVCMYGDGSNLYAWFAR
jgi:hypothetical protein